jgi:hypothetical protein
MRVEALQTLKPRKTLRLAALVLAGAAAALPAADALAQGMNTPASAQFYPFLGYWKGRGQLSVPGKDPELLRLSLSCRKAVAGFAVRCDFVGRNDTTMFTFVEADLMAVDPATGVGHWYAVNNQGEVHDHTAQWPDAATMNARYDWVQNGRQMSENVVFRFREGKHMSFRSVTTQDGQEVGAFFGNMYR